MSTILTPRRISLVGKGRKPRVVPIPHPLADVLREYLDEVRPKLPASPYLFANPRGNRKLRGRYGARALHDLVVEAGTSAGVTGGHLPHRWRHSYATSLVRRTGYDLSMSVNISPRQLDSPGIVDDITEALQASGLGPDHLVVEITENTLKIDRSFIASMTSSERSSGLIHSLVQLGKYLGWTPLRRGSRSSSS